MTENIDNRTRRHPDFDNETKRFPFDENTRFPSDESKKFSDESTIFSPNETTQFSSNENMMFPTSSETDHFADGKVVSIIDTVKKGIRHLFQETPLDCTHSVQADSPVFMTIDEPNLKAHTISLVPTDKTSWLIGRELTCDIRLSPSLRYISKRHATLKNENGKWKLINHSDNGVMIDSCRIMDKEYVFDFDRQQSYIIKLGAIDDIIDPNNICTLTLSQKDNKSACHEPLPDHSQASADKQENHDHIMTFKKKVLKQILAELHLTEKYGAIQEKDNVTQERVKQKLRDILNTHVDEISPYIVLEDDSFCFEDTQRKDEKFIKIEEDIFNEIMCFGPITPLLEDDAIQEIMVNYYDMVFIRQWNGFSEQRRDIRFHDNQHFLSIIQRILEKAGEHLDENTPMAEVHLEDGSRINAIIPPLAIDGPSLTIRKLHKFKDIAMTTDDLIKFGAMNEEMAQFLELAIKAHQNIVISGSTGSGKTTLLNVLGEFIPINERIVIIEDSAELQLHHVNKVRLEARPANIQGADEVTIPKLLVNAMHLCADRIIIGECRSNEAKDILEAMSGYEGGVLTTIRALSAREVWINLKNMVMAATRLTDKAICEQIACNVNIIVQMKHFSDGTRKITEIAEVTGTEDNTITIQPLFFFQKTGFDTSGQIVGKFMNTGYHPQFIQYLNNKYKSHHMNGIPFR